MRITCPEGWTATEMGYDNLTLEKDDGTQTVTYNMWTGVSGGFAFVSMIERGDIVGQMEEGLYGSHGNTTLELKAVYRCKERPFRTLFLRFDFLDDSNDLS